MKKIKISKKTTKQTFTLSKTAPFEYELYDIMKRFEVGEYIKLDGRLWQVYDVSYYTCYFDSDRYYPASEHHAEGFYSEPGRNQKVSLIEVFKEDDPLRTIKRPMKNGFTIRIADYKYY